MRGAEVTPGTPYGMRRPVGAQGADFDGKAPGRDTAPLTRIAFGNPTSPRFRGAR